uniref:Uncharacterized protein n=1 Tax=Cacopsylla melanoneura TaxID=428564 RepID=A0A8D8YE92_9HEMI
MGKQCITNIFALCTMNSYQWRLGANRSIFARVISVAESSNIKKRYEIIWLFIWRTLPTIVRWTVVRPSLNKHDTCHATSRPSMRSSITQTLWKEKSSVPTVAKTSHIRKLSMVIWAIATCTCKGIQTQRKPDRKFFVRSHQLTRRVNTFAPNATMARSIPVECRCTNTRKGIRCATNRK